MEEHHNLAQTVILIGVLSIGAQWLGWALRIPAIVLLSVVGLLVGPVLGWVEPQADFGPLLRPFVAVAVALILFEGGLSLRFHELREAGSGVRRLVTLGVVFSWLLGAAAAWLVAGLSWPVALLLGAILVVTGPTVIMPLLRQAKLARRPASFLKWEGIINDPIGVLIAVVLFEFFALARIGAEPVLKEGVEEEAVALAAVLGELGLALFASVALGSGTGLALRAALDRAWIPPFLKAPVVVAAALGVFGLSNLVLEESGLLATTILGIVIGNTRHLGGIREVRHFNEHVTVILVSVVFILLTADLDPAVVTVIGWRSVAFLAAMLLLVRPIAVLLATVGTDMSWRERALVAWIAPRGVVATAMAGIFGVEMAEMGHRDADMLLPLVFGMVFLTMILHGFSLKWLASRLGLAAALGEGLLIVGASPWSTALARTLKEARVPVLLTDLYEEPLQRARAAGIRVHRGEILAGATEEELDLHDIGYVLAATANDPYNALVCTHLATELGHERVYQLRMHEIPEDDLEAWDPEARGQILIGDHAFFEEIWARYRQGWRFEVVRPGEAGADPSNRPDAWPVLVVRESGSLVFHTPRAELRPESGDMLIVFAPPATALQPVQATTT